MQHTFKALVNWTVNEGEQTNNPRAFSRNHTVHISDSKPDLPVSAAKAFRGEDSLYNPEDLMLSALASCHLMSYLYVCAQHKVEVVKYTDNAEALLEVEFSGRGSFSRALLKPQVLIKERSQIDLAKRLHQDAHQLCFIANSCNFPITVEATVSAVGN